MEALRKAALLFRGIFSTFDVTPSEADAVVQDLLTDEFFTANRTSADAAASDLVTLVSIRAPFDLSVEEFAVIPAGAVTANDSNNATLTVAKADGLGGASTPIATLTTNLAAGNWVTDVTKFATVVNGPARLVAKGQIITIRKSITGTGVILAPYTGNLRVRRV